MIIRALLGLLALTCATAATAARPANHPDWLDGSIPVTSFNQFCTTDCPTGTAPMDAYEPEDVPDVGFVESDWINILPANDGGYLQTGENSAKKLRLTCEFATVKRKDFVLGFGVAGDFGHLHGSAGLANWDENTTWTTARADPVSTCAGGPLFPQLYIEPAVMEKLPNGARASRKFQHISVYYEEGKLTDPNDMTWIRRDQTMIIAANPTDFNDTARRAIYQASGFLYPGSPVQPAGFVGIDCFPDTLGGNDSVPVTRVASRTKTSHNLDIGHYALHIVAEDGSDPWGGQCTKGYFIVTMDGPSCIDGFNLHTENGRTHMWYPSSKGDSSVNAACPSVTVGGVTYNYRKQPKLQIKTRIEHNGWNDYKNLYLESDRMRISTVECPDAAAPCDGVSGGNVPETINGVLYSRVSINACRRTGLDFCPFSTFHADWGHGAKSTIFDEALRECLGITVRGVAPVHGPAECNAARISQTRGLKFGVSPNPALTMGCTNILACTDAVPGNPDLYNPVEAGQKGPFILHGGHGGGADMSANDNTPIKGAAPVDFDLAA